MIELVCEPVYKNEVISTGEDLIVFNLEADGEDVTKEFCTTVKQCIEKGEDIERFFQYNAIAAEFVDGDLEIIYEKLHNQ